MSLLKKELGVAENSWYEASVLRSCRSRRWIAAKRPTFA
jgi:hypothetical protein